VSCRQIPKSLNRVGERKNIAMKKLDFQQMEGTKGGMPCWMAKAGLIAAGALFVVGTAGWGTLALGLLGLSVAEYGLLESCYPQLMD